MGRSRSWSRSWSRSRFFQAGVGVGIGVAEIWSTPQPWLEALLEAYMRWAAELEDRGPANPDPSRRACFVLKGPGSSSGALIRLSGLWSAPRGPDTSRGALIRLSGPRFVKAGPLPDPRDPDSSSGVLIRPVGPQSIPALVRPAEPSLILRGPDAFYGALTWGFKLR